MTFDLTRNATLLKDARTKEPQLALVIEGIPFIFGTRGVQRLWRFDEGFEFDTPGLRFDQPTLASNSKDVIGLDKSTKNLSQQILPDKSGTSSVATMNIELVDLNQEVTDILTFNNNLDDILGSDATIYSGFLESDFPNDYIPLIQGYVDDYKVEQGRFIVSVSHPENLKRKKIFNVYSAKNLAPINDTDTTLTVESTATLIEPVDILTTYIQIDDEVMLVNSFTATTIDVTRAQFGSIAASHGAGADISSVYQLNAQPIEMALKLYMSGEGDNFFGEQNVSNFVQISPILNIANAIFFKSIDIETESFLVAGDTVIVEGSTNGNDGTYTLIDFVNTADGSYITVSDNLNLEIDSNATVKFKSQYNTLPQGAGIGLTNREVDVEAHQNIDRFNPNTLPTYSFTLPEEVDGKEFIDKEIYFPAALYSIPRKAKISLKIVQPPLSVNEIIRFNEETITNLNEVSIERSTHNFFYNTLVYKYGFSFLDDKFLVGQVYINNQSRNRIKVGTSQLDIESLGLVDNNDTLNLINRQALRIFDRYKFAAQQISNVKITYDIGFNLEVGDTVIFGSDTMQLTDLSTGERIFRERLCEVINLKKDIVSGVTTCTLLETAYDLNARYGVISLSSFTTSGSSTTELRIKKSFDVGEYFFESDKWKTFEGQRIRVRSKDYSFDETVLFKTVKATDPNILVLDEPLSVAPPADYYIEVPEYPNDRNIDVIYKDLFVYNVARAQITASIDNISFEADVTNLVVGSQVYIHSKDYSRDSFEDEEVEIESIIGNVVTLNKALEFIPQVGDFVERSNFKDGGFPYLIF